MSLADALAPPDFILNSPRRRKLSKTRAQIAVYCLPVLTLMMEYKNAPNSNLSEDNTNKASRNSRHDAIHGRRHIVFPAKPQSNSGLTYSYRMCGFVMSAGTKCRGWMPSPSRMKFRRPKNVTQWLFILFQNIKI